MISFSPLSNVEFLKTRPARNGHFSRFMDAVAALKVKEGVKFQGITLQGTLDGTPGRGGVETNGIQSSIEEAVNLCKKGLGERFSCLLTTGTASTQPSTYGPKGVIKDLLIFNIHSWPTSSEDLSDFGTEEIELLVNWYKPLLEKAGCDTTAIPEQWNFDEGSGQHWLP